MTSMISLTTLLLSAAAPALASTKGFGLTPVMGFNTYNDIGCSPTQSYVQNTIKSFASKGFLGLGYKYFQIDCGWQARKRQANGSITYDAGAFPDGIAPLSKLARRLGFEWSMYTDQGVYSCDTQSPATRVGSLGHEQEDALQLAGWNVAYMKVDNCFVTAGDNAPKDPRTDFASRYGNWSKAQQSVGIKGMLVCQWGVPYVSPSGYQGPAQWTPALATSFRVSDDIAYGAPDWSDVLRIMNQAINVNLRGLSGPGHFADMDLLEVGNDGLSEVEQASHFAIWAMFKSALMVSTAVPSISNTTSTILSNKDLIAINQDSLGQPVTLVQRFTNDRDVFQGQLANGDRAVLLLDQSGQPRNLTIDFNAIGIKSATVKNLWSGVSTKNTKSYSVAVDAHGTLPLRLSNIKTLTLASPNLTYIEAESGTFAGGAALVPCSGCSNSTKVGNVGNGGTLTLSGIRTSRPTQNVRFDYINCEVGYLARDVNGQNVRGASIRVNNGPAQSVLFPLTGYDWGQDVLKSFLVKLSGFKTKGTNTIEIGGLNGSTLWAPDFDRIAVIA